ncbi:MAG: 5'-deoxynucleotidase [Ruminococcaceae bacterium]|nr:5'-deoxynucleotidase [Oscillospiraceae bacterium]
MKNHFYAMLSRMKNIYRWGLMRNTKSENLSEHSLEVAFVAHALAIINNTRLGGNVDANAVAVAAMYHDTTEIITGDMPTPIKYYNCNIKNVYKDIEKIAENRLLEKLPNDFKPYFTKIYNPRDDVKVLVKAADKISALIKCIEESNMGNREFKIAEKSTIKAIEELNCPEANIFIEEFLESFYLSLDELN